MASRRQIRETVVQFLYCAELADGTDLAALREPFWELVTEAERSSLYLATFRTAFHLAQGRDARLLEFHKRLQPAVAYLSAWPQAEGLQLDLARMAELEAAWTSALAFLEQLPRDDDNDAMAESFGAALDAFFRVDRDLAATRLRFLEGLEDFPALRGHLEAVAASVRRLQRLSNQLRMVEEPEKFPEQADVTKLRVAKTSIRLLRQKADQWVDAVLSRKEAIDHTLAAVVSNYVPERIDPVDRAVLRLGTYEILFASTPLRVAINEAIELAKRFGTTDSHRFVNGVLDRIAQQA